MARKGLRENVRGCYQHANDKAAKEYIRAFFRKCCNCGYASFDEQISGDRDFKRHAKSKKTVLEQSLGSC